MVEPHPNPISYRGKFDCRTGSTKQVLDGAALTRLLKAGGNGLWVRFPFSAAYQPADFAARGAGTRGSTQKTNRNLRSARKQLEDDQKTTKKQPEGNDSSQSLADRNVTFLRENPSAGGREIVESLEGTTEGSVRYQLDKLKRLGRLRRVGPDRGESWMVVDGFDAARDNEPKACTGGQREAGEAPPEHHQKTARKPPEPLPLPDRILALLRQNPSASRREIAATLGTTGSTVRYRLDKLRTAGKIERVGPDKGGHWKVLDGSPAECDPTPELDPRNPR